MIILVGSESHPALLKKDGEILALQLILQDVTDRKIAEHSIQQRVAELEIIHQTSVKLAQASLKVDGIARIAVQQLNSIFNVDESSFFLLDENDHSLQVIANMWIENGQQKFLGQWKTVDLKDYPTTEQVLESIKPAVIQASDPNADPNELGYMQENGTATLVMIPLAVKSHTIGILELETYEKRVYSSSQLNLGMTLANQIAISLDNARLFEEAQSELQERIHAEFALQNRKSSSGAYSKMRSWVCIVRHPMGKSSWQIRL